MKAATIFIKSLFLFSFSAFVLFSFSGCKDDESIVDVGDLSVPVNIFPLVTGHTIVFAEGTLLLLGSETPIAGTEAGFSSSWSVGPKVQIPYQPNTNPYVILDTTKVPAAGLAAGVERQFFIHQDAATGNFDFLTDLSFFFRSQGIYNIPGDSSSGIKSESRVWIELAKPSEGLNKEWITFSANYTTTTLGAVRFEIVAEFTKGTEIIAGTSYTVFKLKATRKIYLGTSSTVVSTGKTAEIWLVEGIGPVYIELIGDNESHGKRQKMTSKNF